MANTAKGATRASKDVPVVAHAPQPFSTLMRESIKEDNNVRTVLMEQLANAKDSKPFVKNFETRFRNIRPTRFTAIEREAGEGEARVNTRYAYCGSVSARTPRASARHRGIVADELNFRLIRLCH